MIVDRVVQDILNFIGQLLWHRKGEIAEPPFIVLDKIQRRPAGLLQHIRKKPQPDTPYRFVSSWIFMPFRRGKPKEKAVDIHIDCADLGAVEIPQRVKLTEVRVKPQPGRYKYDPDKPTHRITIIKASHFLLPNDTWETDEIYLGDFDLQGQYQFSSTYAERVTKRIAERISEMDWGVIFITNWDLEIELCRKEIMGAHFKSTRRVKIDSAPRHIRRGPNV